METKLNYLLRGVMMIAILFIIACNGDETHIEPDEAGYFQLESLIATLNVYDISGRSAAVLANDSVPTEAEIDTWNVIISGAMDTSFNDYSEIKGAKVPLSPGDYTVMVSSENDSVAFDNPYFKGSATFSISAGDTTNVEVSAAPANAKVTIEYAEDIKSTYDNYTATVTAGGKDLVFTKADHETQVGYYPLEENASVEVVLQKTGESDVILSYVIAGKAALGAGEQAPHYVVTVNYDAGGADEGRSIVIAATGERDEIAVDAWCIPETGEIFDRSDSSALNINFENDPTGKIGSFKTTFEWVDNPTKGDAVNSSCRVGKVTRTGETKFDLNNIIFDKKFDFTGRTGFRMKVYSPDKTGYTASVKMQYADSTSIQRTVTRTTTATNEWEELTFDFPAAGHSNKYNRLILFFNIGKDGAGEDGTTYYFDDLELY